MKHNWKKSTLAFLLTLLMLTGLFSALGASAWASPLLDVGATYYIGDTVRLTGSQIAIQDDRGDYRIVNGETTNLTVPAPEYKNGRWEFDFIYPNSNTHQASGLYLGSGKTNGTESVKGFKCVSGDGSQNYPYKFELVLGASSVALNKDSLSLLVGNTETLTAIVTPETAVDKSVTWSSSDESIATVDNTGKVTAVAIGTATITAALNEDPTKSATCEVTVTEVTIDSVPYLDWDGSMLVLKTGDEACKDYTLVSSSTTTFENGNWYVVPSTSIEINSRITVIGEAHLILCDGATLNAKAGITVGSGNSLTIYAQSEGGSMGALNAIGIANESVSPKIYPAGIGSYNNDAGTITINGGNITAYGNQTGNPGQDGGAGIGGGHNYYNPNQYTHKFTGFRGADVTINGGIVTATGSNCTPGIGNGLQAGDKSCSVTINGGIVTANGGVRGAGIGGGLDSRPADVTITGGHVTATSSAVGAGIGNGQRYNYNPNITITGGTVIASGGNSGAGYGRGAGIGSGATTSSSNPGTIEIGPDMTVYAGSQPEPTTVVLTDDFKANHTQQYVMIVVDGAVTKITLAPSEAQTLNEGDSVAFTATLSPDNATNKTVKWSVSDSDKIKLYTDSSCSSEVGSDATETLTVYAKGMAAGTATITVASGADKAMSANCEVTVKKVHRHAGIIFEKWESDTSLPNAAGNYYLTKDVTLSGQWTVSAGETNLCLNGYGIRMAGNTNGVYSKTINVASNRILNLYDCDVSREHYITLTDGRGTAVDDAGPETPVTDGNGVVKVSGGYITGGGRTSGREILTLGGGVYVPSGGTFTMNGGTIVGNTPNQGGGVYVANGGAFTMNGGTITGNAATESGGVYNAGTFNLNGGVITGNTGNNAENNVFISAPITIGGPLAAGTRVGVTMTDPDSFTTGYTEKGNAAHPSTYFTSDDPKLFVVLTDGEAKLADVPKITGADLALNGALDFRFYVDIPAGIDTTGANMSFSIGGGNSRTIENIPLANAGTSTDPATKGQKIFSFPVYAIEMAQDVTAVFHYQAGGEDKTARLTTSIEKYLDKVEELNKDSNYSEKLAQLITATRNYGHYMQPYLANVHNFSVDSYAAIKQGSEYTPLTDDEMTALSGFERKKNSEYDKSNIKSVGYFLTLNERTTLNILLGFNNEPGVISARANGETATVNANPELKNPDGSSATGIYRLIEIPNIAANNLDMTYTVIVKDGETTVYDVNMSALSFVYAVLNANGTGDIEKQALTALYRYNVAADAYGNNG